jgi:hypothetical protein
MTYPSYYIKSLPVYGNQFKGDHNYRQAFIVNLISKFWIKGVLLLISGIFNLFTSKYFFLSISIGTGRYHSAKRANHSFVPTDKFLLQKWKPLWGPKV